VAKGKRGYFPPKLRDVIYGRPLFCIAWRDPASSR